MSVPGGVNLSPQGDALPVCALRTIGECGRFGTVPGGMVMKAAGAMLARIATKPYNAGYKGSAAGLPGVSAIAESWSLHRRPAVVPDNSNRRFNGQDRGNAR